MGYYGICGSYNDIDAEVRVSDGNIYTTLVLAKTGERIHVTLNPLQAKLLGEMLAAIARGVPVGVMDEFINGDMQISVECDYKEDKKNEQNNNDYIAGNHGRDPGDYWQGQEIAQVPAA